MLSSHTKTEIRTIKLLTKPMLRHRVTVPEGQSGEWRVEKFSVTPEDLNFWRAYRDGRAVPPGEFTRLLRGQEVVMSDTPAEVLDHLPFAGRCSGDILVTGLGLGLMVNLLLKNRRVRGITVIEKSSDVIELCGHQFFHALKAGVRQVKVIQADAFTWNPPQGASWDFAWHDIWDSITADNLPEMARLRRRYARRIRERQGCWAEDIARGGA